MDLTNGGDKSKLMIKINIIYIFKIMKLRKTSEDRSLKYIYLWGQGIKWWPRICDLDYHELRRLLEPPSEVGGGGPNDH